jgi:hypothetical protein
MTESSVRCVAELMATPQKTKKTSMTPQKSPIFSPGIDIAIECDVIDTVRTCKLVPFSKKAKQDFGETAVIAHLSLDKDEDTIKFLQKKFTILSSDPNKLAILEYVQKHENVDKGNKVKRITLLLLCNILKKFAPEIEYVYLFALTLPLIKFYKKYGFTSLSKDDPREMFANISTLNSICKNVRELVILN